MQRISTSFSTRGTRHGDYSTLPYTPERKLWILSEFYGSGLSMSAFCAAHNLKESTVSEWERQYRPHRGTEVIPFRESEGRPKYLNNKYIEELKYWMKYSRKIGKSTKDADIRAKCTELHSVQQKELGMADFASPMSQRTFMRIKKEIDAKSVMCQLKTKARIRAESDVRNFVSYYVMLKTFTEHLSPDMKFNWDATTYIVDFKGDNKGTIIFDEDCDLPYQMESEGGLSFGVKMYHFHNAAGTCSPPVFVIADGRQDEDTFDAYGIPGLNKDHDKMGYLVFCRTRNCNSNFYRWFCRTVVVPFVDHIRAHAAGTDVCQYADGSNMRAFLTCDGEEEQIRVFLEPEIREIFADKCIDLGKTPASCSGALQSSDVSKFFLASKKVLKHTNDISTVRNILATRISTLLQSIHVINPDRKTKVLQALLRIHHAINETLTPKIVQEGYRVSGFEPLSIDAVFNRCTSKLKEDPWKNIVDAVPVLCESMSRNGFLTEAEMDILGIPILDDNSKVPKDKRALHQQRAVMINAEEAVTKYINRRAERVASKAAAAARKANRPAELAEKQRQQAETLRIREEKKRKREAARQKEEEKKRAQAGMSRSEIIADNKRRKALEESLRSSEIVNIQHADMLSDNSEEFFDVIDGVLSDDIVENVNSDTL